MLTICTKTINVPPLDQQTVHIFSLNLSIKNDYYEEFKKKLSVDEINRTSRFYFAKDERAFVLRRGLLRVILAHYLGSTTDFIFSYEGKNKPYLKDSSISFNVSFSRNRLLIAVTLNAQLGIDIEFMDKTSDFEQIARNFFTPTESNQILMLSAQQRLLAFYACWTRKEAYIKALAEGLYKPLKSFQVSVGEDAELVWDQDNANFNQWRLINVHVDENFSATLAINRANVQVLYFQC